MENDSAYYADCDPIIVQFMDMAVIKKIESNDRKDYQNNIIDHRKEVIAHLKKLSREERQQIADFICSISDDNYFLEHRRDEAFRIARYACFNRKQIMPIAWSWSNFPFPEHIDEMMDWYTPEWLADYTHEQLKQDNGFFNYASITKWRRKGLINEIAPQRVAEKLVHAFIVYRNYQEDPPNTIEYIEDIINKYPEVLEEIELLFRCATEVYHVDRSSVLGDQLGMGPISYIFKRYSEEGVFDRQWVLKSAITACSNNFSDKERETLYWYPNLLAVMKPTTQELLSLQNELINALSCVYAYVQTNLLKYIKTIAKEKSFNVDGFIEQLPVLLSSETKTVIKGTLPIVSELLKKYPEKRNKLCEHLAIIFLRKDEELQIRAAKLIAQYGDKDSTAQVLSNYKEMMLMSVRETLKDFLDTEITSKVTEEKEIVSIPLINNDNRIDEIDSVENLIFRLGRAFEDFTPDSIDIIPPAIIKLDKEIDKEVLQQFGPAMKAAEKTITKWVRDSHTTDEILAFYFLMYCDGKWQRLKQEGASNKHLCNKFEKLRPTLKSWITEITRKVNFLPFTPYIAILNQFLKIVFVDNDVPLLSTPTHSPCWIDPAIFLERFNRYKDAKKMPASFDLQIAIQRLAIDDTEKAKQIYTYTSKDFYHELFRYIFDETRPLPKKIEHPELWLGATFRKYGREVPDRLVEVYGNMYKPLMTGIFEWETVMIPREKILYGYSIPSDKLEKDFVPMMQFKYTPYPVENFKNNTYAGAYMWVKFQYMNNAFVWDMPHLMRLFPNNPEVLSARYICEYAQIFDADSDNVLISVLELFADLNRPLLPMGSLYLALCLLYRGKTTRLYAAEVWASLTEASQADHREIGRSLGRMLKDGYAPLKRFTDNVYEVMLNRSSLHNSGLEQMIVSCLKQLDEKPLPSLKKLLEAYKELLAQNNSHVDTEIIPLLDSWTQQASLKKIIKDILNH